MDAASRPGVTPWRTDLTVLGIGFLLLVAWDASGLDLVAARAFGTPGGFPWRSHWLTSGLLHEGGRAVGWLVLASLVVNVFKPLWSGPSKAERVAWMLVTLLCLLIVPALKQVSQTSCPWDLAEFGGAAQHVSHWRFGVPDGGAGHCFPSGHAVSAFAFLGGWFVLRRHRPAFARAWLVAVLAAGTAYGLAQLVRGAHYPSHTAWSAWWCWLTWLLAWRAVEWFLARRAGRAAAPRQSPVRRAARASRR